MQTAEDVPLFIAAAHGPMRSYFDRRWHYIQEGDGRELLYAYRTDTEERHNLALEPAADSVLSRIRAKVATLPAQP